MVAAVSAPLPRPAASSDPGLSEATDGIVDGPGTPDFEIIDSENKMKHRLMTYSITAGVLAIMSSASGAQDIGQYRFGYGSRDSYNAAYVGAYGDNGYWEGTHGIYGGPSGDLFNYAGPNRGAMERATR